MTYYGCCFPDCPCSIMASTWEVAQSGGWWREGAKHFCPAHPQPAATPEPGVAAGVAAFRAAVRYARECHRKCEQAETIWRQLEHVSNQAAHEANEARAALLSAIVETE